MKNLLAHLWTSTIAIFLLLEAGAVKCSAFSAPLQSVSASQNGNSVQFSVYDPVRGQTIYGSINMVAVDILNQNGIVACYDNSGNVQFAVYDPNAGTWKYGLGSWSGTDVTLVDSGGVVAWGSDYDASEHYATYDPYRGAWQFGSGPGNEGSFVNTDGGTVAWLNDYALYFAIYDPSRGAWESGPVQTADSVYVDPYGTVNWSFLGGQTYMNGYDQASGTWVNGPTHPFASFVVSAISGYVPTSVWFTDMSIGAAGWQWNFGDGSSSTVESLYHYYDPNDFGTNLAVSLNVTGANGTSIANLSLNLPPFFYTENNGTISIYDYKGPGGSVTIPSTINDLTVTSIGANAFLSCTNLTSVTIPNSVTSIGNAAFEDCTSLTNVTIPNSVTSIGTYAFEACYSLANVIIGTGVTSIGYGAFDGADLSSVMIPASVTSIGDEAFLDNPSLTAITVDPANLDYTVVNGVLFNNTQTTLVYYPEGMSESSYTVPSGVTALEAAAFAECKLANITFDSGLASIGASEFFDCHELSSVTIPNSVTSIGEEAFLQCNDLTNVAIGSGVTSIGEYAFASCYDLASVYFTGNAPANGGEVFYTDGLAKTYYLPGTTGWSLAFWGYPSFEPPAILWNPKAQTGGVSFGVRTNKFGFNIIGTSGLVIVVDACTNLANPVWNPVATNTLTGGSSYFSDPQWTNYPSRFYGFSWP
jgi:hypothetical protein